MIGTTTLAISLHARFDASSRRRCARLAEQLRHMHCGWLAPIACLLVSRGAFASPVSFAARGPRPATYAASVAFPKFTRFGWASPPVDSTSPGRITQMADAGFNLAIPPLDDAGRFDVNLARLAAGSGRGVRMLVADWQLNAVMPWIPGTLWNADSVVARYRDDPTFAGYYLGDEPTAADFGGLGAMIAILRERDPSHPAWNNLLGRGSFGSAAAFTDYLQQYVAAAQPAVLCDDHYDFYTWGDRGLVVENIAITASIARANGLPFWGIVQLVQTTNLRAMTPGLLRWQVAHWLAHGATGIGYFTYWTPKDDLVYQWQPAMIDRTTGVPTVLYDMVRNVNDRLAPFGELLAGTRWVRTVYAGSVPTGGTAFTPDTVLTAVAGRAVIGSFVDSLGTPIVLVGNSDSTAAARVTLTLANGRKVARLAKDGATWDELWYSGTGQLDLTLAAGDYAVLRLPSALASCTGRNAPHMDVAPNPARSAVTFAFGRADAARAELVDVSGRRVWSYEIAAGARELVWRGETDSGAPAVPGIYFLRMSSARGVVQRRFTWLGP